METPHRPAEQQADHQRHAGHRQRMQGERHDEADHRRADQDDRATGVERELQQANPRKFAEQAEALARLLG